MSSWWTGIAAAEATVECTGHAHTLRWERGALTAVDHGDPEAEATLGALAGEPATCLQLLRAWNRRREDPRVLMLGSRGVRDPLDIAVIRNPYQPAPTRRTRETDLLDLLALGGGLPDRLQAHVAATWTRRLRTGHAALAATLPQLQAALYGRALAALRVWLGEPGLSIELSMVDAAAARHLERTGDVVTVSLPFAWLTEVWARGLTTIFGRLCLDAQTEDGSQWTLLTVGTDLGQTTQLSVTMD